MRSISDTLARLTAARTALALPGRQGQSGRLVAMTDFGSNPGALRAFGYVPPHLAAKAPLVVVLHGCTQTADGYDAGSGWSELAQRDGFAVLYPEQQRANNHNLCFNWFAPGDIRRDSGEALSIRQMIGAMILRHDLDPARVFITGLSAGGAMTSTMLATYPELFAGGAIIAGLPHGCASSVPEALDRMRGHGLPTAAVAARQLGAASGHDGPWPVISVWHGTQDHVVSPANAEAIIAQWQGVQGLSAVPTREDTVDGQTRRSWCDDAGTVRIEAITIAGMGHGTPLDTSSGIGVAGPYMLDAGISSTRRIAQSWLISTARTEPARPRTVQPARSPQSPCPQPVSGPAASAGPAATTGSVGKVIEDALRAAGLMR